MEKSAGGEGGEIFIITPDAPGNITKGKKKRKLTKGGLKKDYIWDEENKRTL